MWTILVLAGWSSMGVDETAHCDLVEINHCHDAEGKLKFVQVVAWDWCPQYRRFDAQGWRMVVDWRRKEGCVVVLDDHDREVLIECKYYRETWTNYDTEVESRKLFPERYRRQVFH